MLGDITVGPVTLTYEFPTNHSLPAVGQVMKGEGYTLVVVKSDPSTGELQLLLTPDETLSARQKRQEEEIRESAEAIAELIYSATSEGMTSLIGWATLPESEKTKYLELSNSIIRFFSDNKLLAVQYTP